MAITMNGGSSKEGNGNGNKGGRCTMATAMRRAMATTMRVAGDEEGNGNSGKGDGNGIEGGRRSTAMRAMVTRVAAEQW